VNTNKTSLPCKEKPDLILVAYFVCPLKLIFALDFYLRASVIFIPDFLLTLILNYFTDDWYCLMRKLVPRKICNKGPATCLNLTRALYIAQCS
jgi:hypothetical protein